MATSIQLLLRELALPLRWQGVLGSSAGAQVGGSFERWDLLALHLLLAWQDRARLSLSLLSVIT